MATGADYLRNPAPRYPEEARANRWEGVVMLLVGVSAQGRVDSISVESSSGHAVLDAAALKAVREYRFRPAEVMGVPVPCTLKVPIRFKLR
ncbi:MAG: energy transducer TonB [Verrucomicrobiae bacterium]|nr:energy transducer TonB [Verrucomicrobiae bacterium]